MEDSWVTSDEGLQTLIQDNPLILAKELAKPYLIIGGGMLLVGAGVMVWMGFEMRKNRKAKEAQNG